MKQPQHILVCRLSALGDVAMTIPVVYSLARQYPSLRIDFLTRRFFARMLVNAPDNIRIIEADLDGRHKSLLGLLRLVKELRRNDYDAVADLHNILRSWVIDVTFLLMDKRVVVVEKKRSQRKPLLRNKVPQTPFIQRYVNVFIRMGLPVSLDFKSLFPKNTHPSSLIDHHPAIGIAPFARYESKTYPKEQMREVARILTEKGFWVYLFGAGKGDAVVFNQWEKEFHHCVSMAGKYSLEEEILAMASLDAMVSMDSANQHIASLVGTRTVTVWGSTAPCCGFLAYGQQQSDAVCLNLPCQPCSVGGRKTLCALSFACLKQIRPAEIVEQVIKVFNIEN